MIIYYTLIKLICPHILKENERTVIVKKMICMALNLDFIDHRPHHLKRRIKQVGNDKLKSKLFEGNMLCHFTKLVCRRIDPSSGKNNRYSLDSRTFATSVIIGTSRACNVQDMPILIIWHRSYKASCVGIERDFYRAGIVSLKVQQS